MSSTQPLSVTWRMLAIGPANPRIQNGSSYQNRSAVEFQDSPPLFRNPVVQGLLQAIGRKDFAEIAYSGVCFSLAGRRVRLAP